MQMNFVLQSVTAKTLPVLFGIKLLVLKKIKFLLLDSEDFKRYEKKIYILVDTSGKRVFTSLHKFEREVK